MSDHMQAEPGTRYEYAVSLEDRYLRGWARGPEVAFSKVENGGGGNIWQIMIREGFGKHPGDLPADVQTMRAGGVHWEMWPDTAEQVRADCAALFAALDAAQPATVGQVADVLRRFGAADTTDRTRD